MSRQDVKIQQEHAAGASGVNGNKAVIFTNTDAVRVGEQAGEEARINAESGGFIRVEG